MKKKVVAIIPARGGSKGIPDKNIKDFCGKPLVAWSILQCLATPEIDEVYVSSDSEKILDVAAEFGAKKIKRPDELSGDKASSESAIVHALETIDPSQIEIAMMLQATSPLRKKDDLGRAVRQILDEKLDSSFSGAVLDDFLIWEKQTDGTLKSFNYDYKNRGRRQDRKPQYVENGSVYLFRPEIMLDANNRIGGKVGICLMDFWQSFELDSPEDWPLLEVMFQHYLGKNYL